MSSFKNGPSQPAPPPYKPFGPTGSPTHVNKPSSPYGRFIPREELSGFSAWNPNDLTGGAEPADKGVRPPAPPEPELPSTEELVAEAARVARSAGYQDGYRDGLVALEGFKQSFATQITAQIGEVSQCYMDQLQVLQQQMARALAVSATHLARQMVRSEIHQHPELVISVAQEAVDTLLLSARHISVRVNPEDHDLVVQGAAEVLTARGARVVSDPAVSRGGCVVESDIGVIDGSIEARWRRAAASLGCDDAWQEAPQPQADAKLHGQEGL